jgi:hypothetical protein
MPRLEVKRPLGPEIITPAPSPSERGGAKRKRPVDLFPAERMHTVLVHPGGNNQGKGINRKMG